MNIAAGYFSFFGALGLPPICSADLGEMRFM